MPFLTYLVPFPTTVDRSGRKSTHLNIATRNNANTENRTQAACAASERTARYTIASRIRSKFEQVKAPENEIPSLVSFPGLDQGKVSEDGAFHDVVFAVENLERRKCSDLIKKSILPSPAIAITRLRKALSLVT